VFCLLLRLTAALCLLLSWGYERADARTLQADPVATTFIYPVGNANVAPTWNKSNGNGYYITQGFNDSCDPSLNQGYYAYGLYYCGHTGIDLASDGTDAYVHATAAGVVTEAQYDSGYGVTVRLRHLLASGTYVYSQYEHMQYGSLQVYVGEVVNQGQVLGLVGATGFANGTHLHFEMKTFDGGGPGYTFGNDSLISSFYDPLAFVAAHSSNPLVLITPSGQAIPEFPAEADSVLHAFLRQYKHYVVVSVDSGLNVRAGPSTGYRTLGVALRGAKLGFVKARGQWLNVALPQNVQGWVSRDWVSGYGYWDTPWPPRGSVATVSTDGLNIHAMPGQSNPIVGICFEGDLVSVRTRTAHWSQVTTREGTNGWVLSSYLTKPGEKKQVGGGPSILAEADVLHVRSGPGLQYPVVGSVFRGTSMKLVKVSPHWAAVILPGGTAGWVARPYTNLKPGGSTVKQPSSHQLGNAQATGTSSSHVVKSASDLHQGPGDRYKVVARVSRSTRVIVLNVTPHWARVALPASRIEGWIVRATLQ
jgi:murein DD-endopeptidase MepM/ murein hydrolase activator NlpD/SH3-like domain-containing protein